METKLLRTISRAPYNCRSGNEIMIFFFISERFQLKRSNSPRFSCPGLYSNWQNWNASQDFAWQNGITTWPKPPTQLISWRYRHARCARVTASLSMRWIDYILHPLWYELWQRNLKTSLFDNSLKRSLLEIPRMAWDRNPSLLQMSDTYNYCTVFVPLDQCAL